VKKFLIAVSIASLLAAPAMAQMTEATAPKHDAMGGTSHEKAAEHHKAAAKHHRTKKKAKDAEKSSKSQDASKASEGR
jgi:Ni/Co efflux regulator RcnB